MIMERCCMKKCLFLCVAVWCSLSFFSGWAQPSAVDVFKNDSVLRPASVGVYVSNVNTGEVIASLNESQAHYPASTLKTITSATALRLLGSSFTPCTWVDGVGVVDGDGVLQGDLVVRGGGDPTLGSEYGSHAPTQFVDSIVQVLQEWGIRRIAGTIRVDNSFFEGYPLTPRAMLEDVMWDYGAPCYAFNYRDNRLIIKLKDKGDRYCVAGVSPDCLWEVSVDVEKGERENLSVVWEGNRCLISGTIPRKYRQYTVALSVSRPDEVLVRELTRRLNQEGIIVAGKEGVGFSSQPIPLLRFRGDSLGYVVRELNHRSDNLYAESVLRWLPAESDLKGSAENGLKTIRRYWHDCGVDSLALFQYDGAGLARNNKVSAEYIGRVLEIMDQDSIEGECFVQSLPLVGREGTVKNFMKNHKLSGELRLKSGSMSDVHAYAGYYTTANNRYAVVVIVNNYACPRKEIRAKIATLLTDIFSGKGIE